MAAVKGLLQLEAFAPGASDKNRQTVAGEKTGNTPPFHPCNLQIPGLFLGYLFGQPGFSTSFFSRGKEGKINSLSVQVPARCPFSLFCWSFGGGFPY